MGSLAFSITLVVLQFLLLKRFQDLVLGFASKAEALPPPSLPAPPDDPAPEEDESAYIHDLYEMSGGVRNDVIEAILEAQEKTTQGASERQVCSHWAEEDERLAIAEEIELARLRPYLRSVDGGEADA